MTGIFARRSFSLDDQRSFAALSGDWNPLHVDPVAARRTLMGAPVVHGVHLVLWALDRYVARIDEPREIAELRATFSKPAFLDREIELELDDGDVVRIRATSGANRVLELSLRLARASAHVRISARAWPESIEPEVMTLDEAVSAQGQIDLAIDAGRANAAFPSAATHLGLDTMADLLATTRLVGMRCPGRHSLFGGLVLSSRAPDPERDPVLTFRVASAKPAYSVLAIDIVGSRLAGTLEAFVPSPPCSTSMDEALIETPAASFAGQRALVVGGSRGLGEAFAKVIASGGGEVCITYHRGEDDARRVVDDIRAAGRIASAIHLDIAAPRLDWPFALPPTHLYYFAAPTLYSIRKGAGWNADELDLLMRYFVTGLRATVAATGKLAKSFVVWTPSTTMLDTPAGGTVYCVAKAAMEELCRHLPSQFPVTVFAPRLGRVDTDQTRGLIRVATPSPLGAALDQLTRTP